MQRHVIVVGAGIVGLACAYQLVLKGMRVTVIDRDPEGDKASYGNAGALAVTEVLPASVPGVLWRVPGWLLDPLGPLTIRPRHALALLPWLMRFAKVGSHAQSSRISQALLALNARVYDDFVPMLQTIGLAGELHRKGALTLYATAAGFQRDVPEWHAKRAYGITCDELSGAQTREMEPALGPKVSRAIFTPDWSYVSDPKRIVARLRTWIVEHGATIRTDEVLGVDMDAATPARLQMANGKQLGADNVVIAAGAWSGLLARDVGDRVLLESERGYNTTLPNSGITLERQLIFAEEKFVATPLEVGLRVGGAAEFGGLEAKANFKRSAALLILAKRYLPNINDQGGTVWAGHRPTTPDTLPVIGNSHFNPNVTYAFGHGHLGLTQSATTGKLVAETICGTPSCLDMTPYDIGRFAQH